MVLPFLTLKVSKEPQALRPRVVISEFALPTDTRIESRRANARSILAVLDMIRSAKAGQIDLVIETQKLSSIDPAIVKALGGFENMIPEEWKVSKYQLIPLKGTPEEMMATWSMNDWAMICGELSAYHRGETPDVRTDTIRAGRRLEEVLGAYQSKISKLEVKKKRKSSR
jgi:hypothetical protein